MNIQVSQKLADIVILTVFSEGEPSSSFTEEMNQG